MSKIHEWLFDEGSGLPQDSVGTSHATAMDATWGTDADLGACVQFDGTQEVELPQLGITPTTLLTIEVYFKPTDVSSEQRVFGFEGDPAVSLGFQADGSVHTWYWTGVGHTNNFTPGSFVNDTTYKLRITIDFPSDELKVYIGTTVVKETTLGGSQLTTRFGAGSNDFGRLGYYDNRYFKGWLKRVTIWDSIEVPTSATSASQPAGESFDDSGVKAPITQKFWGRTDNPLSSLSGYTKKDDVTNGLTVTITDKNSGWYQWSVTPSEDGAWEVIIDCTNGEQWHWNLNELPEATKLSRPVITDTNYYEITEETPKIAYSKSVSVNEVTKAKVTLPHSMSNYIVDVSAQSSSRAQVSIKKAVDFFEIYGDREAVILCTILDISKLNRDTQRAVTSARRSALTEAESVVASVKPKPGRPLKQF